MAEFDIELGRLNVAVANATLAFMKVVNIEGEKKSAANEAFDIQSLSNELKFCTPEGIDLNIAIEKRDKYKVENGIS